MKMLSDPILEKTGSTTLEYVFLYITNALKITFNVSIWHLILFASKKNIKLKIENLKHKIENLNMGSRILRSQGSIRGGAG